MNFLTTPVLYGLGAAVVVIGLFAGVQTVRLSSEKAAHATTKADNAKVLQNLAELTAKTATALRTRESEVSNLLSSSNQAREQGIANAVQAQQEFVAGVRSGAIKLRGIWSGCPAPASVPGNAGGESGIDAEADLRAESAGRIIRAGDDADIQVQGLQDYALACQALTKPINP